MMRHTSKIILLVLIAAFLGGCVNHIAPYEQKRREYRPDQQVVPEYRLRADGAIWSQRDSYNRLFTDPRASQINDIVVVRIEENSTANQSAQTQLGKDSQISAQIDNLMGALKLFEEANPNFDRKNLLGSVFKSDFDGGGKTSRAGKVIATVPAQIRTELPDGNLFIEGHRVILVNNEEAHFYVSGIIRPHDIDRNNSISSSLIADAQIEFTGRGVVTEKNRPGWGSRALDYIWPF